MPEDNPVRMKKRADDLSVEIPETAPLEASNVMPRINSLSSTNKRPWWFFELWWEIRPIFKELIKHVLLFGMLIGTLTLFHYVLDLSGLPPHQKEILDKVHFYGSAIALVIYTISFIIKVLVYEFRGERGD